MANGWGGKRAGAGRPPKTTLYATEIRQAERKVADKLPHIVDRMLELSEGILVQEEDEKTGETHIYARPPDRMALEYLWNRIAGKPVEHVELDADIDTGESSDRFSDAERAAIRAALLSSLTERPGA